MRSHRMLIVALCSVALSACGDSGGRDETAGTGGVTGGSGGVTGGTGGATGGTGGDTGGTGGDTGGTGGTTGGTGGTTGGTGGATGGTGGDTGGTGGATGGTGGEPTGDPAVRLVGRFDESSAAGPQFEWSGSEMIARFSGTSVSVHLNGSPNYFEAVVDGQASKVNFTGGDQTISLATGLAPGNHEVELYRITEAFFWTTQFLGYEFGSGSLLAPYPAPDRRLEVIGDSISAGYGNEGTSEACGFSASTENHYLTYESIAARSVGADLITLAWSGIGMYRNGDGTTADTMPSRYLLTMPASSTTAWNFASYVPQAVVINLGTNDFAAGDPGQAFVNAYVQFVTDLRGRYPGAIVYLATSPMLSEPQHGQQRTYLQAVISARATAGDTNLRLLEFATQVAADGLGCDWHPNLVTHQKMAVAMTDALHTDLGW
jgi:hypothetical protein